jgi:hypothetical protein
MDPITVNCGRQARNFVKTISDAIVQFSLEKKFNSFSTTVLLIGCAASRYAPWIRIDISIVFPFAPSI